PAIPSERAVCRCQPRGQGVRPAPVGDLAGAGVGRGHRAGADAADRPRGASTGRESLSSGSPTAESRMTATGIGVTGRSETGLAFVADRSVHRPVAQHVIYVRASDKEATAADISDELQEAACRAMLPPAA